MRKLLNWQLRDAVMVATLGVLFAVVYLGFTSLWIALEAALTPLGLGPFADEAIYGAWFMAGSLAAFIVRKPGAAFTAELMASVIEMMLGYFGGPVVVLFGLVQGAGNEAGFAAFRYRKYHLASMCLSGALAAVFSFGTEILLGTVVLLSPGFVAAKLGVRILSAIAFTGFVCYFAGRGLARTGVLKSYPSGALVGGVGGE
jgi:energy-coupling factor transport system substrate-specific component